MTISPFKAAAAAALLATAGSTFAAPTWITIGDKAHALVAKVAPNARTLASRQVPVNVPVSRGSSDSASSPQFSSSAAPRCDAWIAASARGSGHEWPPVSASSKSITDKGSCTRTSTSSVGLQRPCVSAK